MRQANCSNAVYQDVMDIQVRLEKLLKEVFTNKSHEDYKICG